MAAGQARWLAELAASWPRSVVWENLTYPGEVLSGQAPERTWTAPLPPEAGFRLALRTTPGPLPASGPDDPRVVFLAPAAAGAEERAALLEAAVAAAVAQDLPSLAAGAAGARLARLAVPLLALAAAAVAAGQAAAQPPLVAGWSDSLRWRPSGI